MSSFLASLTCSLNPPIFPMTSCTFWNDYVVTFIPLFYVSNELTSIICTLHLSSGSWQEKNAEDFKCKKRKTVNSRRCYMSPRVFCCNLVQQLHLKRFVTQTLLDSTRARIQERAVRRLSRSTTARGSRRGITDLVTVTLSQHVSFWTFIVAILLFFRKNYNTVRLF